MRPAEAELVADVPVGENALQRLFQQAFARHIVIIVAEARHPEVMGQGVLAFEKCPVQQVVPAETRMRGLGLLVTGKERTGRPHIVPFREALAVDGVIFGNGVKLGQIEGKALHAESCS